jgi:hypothetical protein
MLMSSFSLLKLIMNYAASRLSIALALLLSTVAQTLVATPSIAAPTQSERLTAQSGKVKATLTFEKNTEFGFMGKNIRLQVDRDGILRFDGTPKSGSSPNNEDPEEGNSTIPYAYQKSPLTVRDLDKDGEPEILIDYFSGGAHCCVYTLIYRYDADRETYEAINFSTRDMGYRLEDLNRDGRPEFVTADARFAYAFSSFAGSGFPLKIWNYKRGQMVDVTKQYPQRVRNSAYRYWTNVQTILREGQDREVKGQLAAYLADKYTLGEAEDGWKKLRAIYKGDDRADFFEKLEKFLKETGYDR